MFWDEDPIAIRVDQHLLLPLVFILNDLESLGVVIHESSKALLIHSEVLSDNLHGLPHRHWLVWKAVTT